MRGFMHRRGFLAIVLGASAACVIPTAPTGLEGLCERGNTGTVVVKNGRPYDILLHIDKIQNRTIGTGKSRALVLEANREYLLSATVPSGVVADKRVIVPQCGTVTVTL